MKYQRLMALFTPLVLFSTTVTFPQTPSRIEFDVASIKPNNTPPGSGGYGGGYCRGTDTKPGTYPRLAAPTSLGQCLFTRVPLTYLIRSAYGSAVSFPALADMIKGQPDWGGSQRFDVWAKAEDPSTATAKVLRQMLRALLEDRFKLKAHFADAELQGYGLYVSKNGPRLEESSGRRRLYDAVHPLQRIGQPVRFCRSASLLFTIGTACQFAAAVKLVWG